ncbi:MAG: biotin--[acetyl-CoA-carboxylase] ligase [Prevotella sp.]|jgi:BirA family biotin operon repressor/biotin-[acetyl-CoA-carboxylase] ligase|nr:biotin--[acetyl-CoA-carboxylase] ligase [Prevotella sp.]
MLQSYKIFLYLCIVNWEIIHIDETDSTNQWVKTHKGNSPFCVITEYQTAGRGCGTNTWESERGKNLLFSLMLCPDSLPANKQFHISMAISLAIVEAVGQLVGDLSIKWPNDIYWRNGKLAGILIENRLQGNMIKESIIGVGLNVNQQEFQSKAPNPVSLWQITGQETDREQLLKDILQALDKYMAHGDLGEMYRSQLYRRKGFHPYADKDGAFMAEIVDVEDDGHLLLSDDSGRERRYAFKEVTFII